MATLRKRMRGRAAKKAALAEDPVSQLKALEKQQVDLLKQVEKFTRKCGEDHGSKEDSRNEQRLQQLELQERQVADQMKEIRDTIEQAAASQRERRKNMRKAATMSRASTTTTKKKGPKNSPSRKNSPKSKSAAPPLPKAGVGSVGRSARTSRRRNKLSVDLASGRSSDTESSRSESTTPTQPTKFTGSGKDSVNSNNSSSSPKKRASLDLSSMAADLDLGKMFEMPPPSSAKRGGLAGDFFTMTPGESSAIADALADLNGLDSDDDSSSADEDRGGQRAARFPTGPVDFDADGFQCHVVRDFANAEDMNLAGLQRAKKGKRATMGANAGGKITYQMEDQSVCLCPVARNELESSAFFGVMDGHIDKNAAFAAKQLLPLHFVRHLAESTKANDGVIPTDLTDDFFAAFKSCDADLKRFEFEGCTATGVYVWRSGDKRYVQCANVGDSSAFMYRRKRRAPSAASSGDESNDDAPEYESGYEACWLSFDHKVSSETERARLKKAGIQITDHQTRLNGLAVSRSLGDHFAKDNNTGVIGVPYVSPVFDITNADDGVFIVLASDGLWDVLSGTRACEIAHSESGLSAQQQAEKLLKVALSPRTNHDNITITCVQLV